MKLQADPTSVEMPQDKEMMLSSPPANSCGKAQGSNQQFCYVTAGKLAHEKPESEINRSKDEEIPIADHHDMLQREVMQFPVMGQHLGTSLEDTGTIGADTFLNRNKKGSRHAEENLLLLVCEDLAGWLHESQEGFQKAAPMVPVSPKMGGNHLSCLDLRFKVLYSNQVFTINECPQADDYDDIFQKEVPPEFPMQQREADHRFFLQRIVEPQIPLGQREVELPSIPEESVLSPRGRRPVSACGGRQPCPLDELMDSSTNNLKTFPPGRPNVDNIGNICRKNRPKTSYGFHNLPSTGYSYLSRQGDAINALEKGFSACCGKPDKLQCAENLVHISLMDALEDNFYALF
ncbi:unnamed protein product [Ranitomeya imitator]|uniref:Uncharacterized protein n=1 Tax=Ranitomeya imitator TaxID=111125 RepID=A0ABN9L022_9NEOB|nr:unnamed protein product [Ranitomeya imitator]